MQLKEALAEADSGGDPLVDNHGGSLCEGVHPFCTHLDVARVAHEEERSQVAQHVGQSAQRRAGLLPRLGTFVAAWTEGNQIFYLVGLAIVLVLTGDVVVFTKRPYMMNVQSSTGFAPLHTTRAAAMSISIKRKLTLLLPIWPVIIWPQ